MAHDSSRTHFWAIWKSCKYEPLRLAYDRHLITFPITLRGKFDSDFQKIEEKIRDGIFFKIFITIVLKNADEISSALSLLKRMKLTYRVMMVMSIRRFPFSPFYNMNQL